MQPRAGLELSILMHQTLDFLRFQVRATTLSFQKTFNKRLLHISLIFLTQPEAATRF